MFPFQDIFLVTIIFIVTVMVTVVIKAIAKASVLVLVTVAVTVIIINKGIVEYFIKVSTNPIARICF